MPKTGHTEEAHECQRAATLGTSFRVRRVATVGGRGICAAAVTGVTAGAGATRARTGGAAGGALACGPALVLSTLTGSAGAAVADPAGLYCAAGPGTRLYSGVRFRF